MTREVGSSNRTPSLKSFHKKRQNPSGESKIQCWFIMSSLSVDFSKWKEHYKNLMQEGSVSLFFLSIINDNRDKWTVLNRRGAPLLTVEWGLKNHTHGISTPSPSSPLLPPQLTQPKSYNPALSQSFFPLPSTNWRAGGGTTYVEMVLYSVEYLFYEFYYVDNWVIY